jgi:hypothetical protein
VFFKFILQGGHNIFVVRKDPEPMRIRFSYKQLSRGEGRGIQFQLRDGDIIVVE